MNWKIINWKKILIILGLIILTVLITLISILAGIILIFLEGIGYFVYKKMNEYKKLKENKEKLALDYYNENIENERRENGRTDKTTPVEVRGIGDQVKEPIEPSKSDGISTANGTTESKQSIRIY